MADEQDSVELNLAQKSLKVAGQHTITGLTLILVVLLAYGGYTHTVDAKEDNRGIIQAIKDSAQIQREQLNAMREQNCLARLSPEQRKRQDEIDFCRSLGRGR